MAQYTFFAVITTLMLAGCSLGSDDIQMPHECQDMTYCTRKPEGYSTYVSEMDSVIKASKYWAGIGAQISVYKDITPVYQVADGNNCGSITKVKKPYIIKALVNTTSTETQNKIVVQSQYFTQKIYTTICLDKELSCFEDVKAQQDDIDTSCEESYTTITIYVFEGGKIKPQPFRIPVSCSCKVTFKRFKK